MYAAVVTRGKGVVENVGFPRHCCDTVRAVRAMMLNVVPQGAAWALQGQEAVIMLIGWCVRESAKVVP